MSTPPPDWRLGPEEGLSALGLRVDALRNRLGRRLAVMLYGVCVRISSPHTALPSPTLDIFRSATLAKSRAGDWWYGSLVEKQRRQPAPLDRLLPFPLDEGQPRIVEAGTTPESARVINAEVVRVKTEAASQLQLLDDEPPPSAAAAATTTTQAPPVGPAREFNFIKCSWPAGGLLAPSSFDFGTCLEQEPAFLPSPPDDGARGGRSAVHFTKQGLFVHVEWEVCEDCGSETSASDGGGDPWLDVRVTVVLDPLFHRNPPVGPHQEEIADAQEAMFRTICDQLHNDAEIFVERSADEALMECKKRVRTVEECTKRATGELERLQKMVGEAIQRVVPPDTPFAQDLCALQERISQQRAANTAAIGTAELYANLPAMRRTMRETRRRRRGISSSSSSSGGGGGSSGGGEDAQAQDSSNNGINSRTKRRRRSSAAD